MGLFDKKKKDRDETSFSEGISKSNLTRIMPNLPELPRYEAKGGSRFPVYESDINSIKEQIEGDMSQKRIESLDIPVRKKVETQTFKMPDIEGFRPQQMPVQPAQTMNRPMGDKPIFVKIDKYKEAVNSLENIKEICKNADSLLNEINRLREEENRELEKWRTDIGRIKDKLLMVDKKLFEG